MAIYENGGFPVSKPGVSQSQKFAFFLVSGLQKGPAERGHVKKRQKSSKSVKKFFDTFRQFSRRAKNVKNRQKASKSFSTLFDNFRAAPLFRPFLQSADLGSDKSHPPPQKKTLSDGEGLLWGIWGWCVVGGREKHAQNTLKECPDTHWKRPENTLRIP